jgi:RHS repeat-associated protein
MANSINGTVVQEWDGSTWLSVPAPDLNSESTFSGIDALSPTDVWIAGFVINPDNSTTPLIEHWNGSAWSVAFTGFGGTYNRFSSISFDNPTDGWAVGIGSGGSLAEHWDGSQWTAVSAPGSGLTDVSASQSSGTTNVFAVIGTCSESGVYEGDGVLAWNGTSFVFAASFSGQCPGGPGTIDSSYSAVTTENGLPPNSAPGYFWVEDNAPCTHLAGFDYFSCDSNIGRFGVPGNDVNAIAAWPYSAQNPQSAWAVGTAQGVAGIWSCDAGTFRNAPVCQSVPTPSLGASSELDSVSVQSTTNAWAAGTYTDPSGNLSLLIEHWDGTAWRIVPSAQPPLDDPMTAQRSLGGGPICIPCLVKAIARVFFGDPVDSADGNVYETATDVSIAGRGFPLAFSRTYNSYTAAAPGAKAGVLGFGWVTNLGASLSISPSTVTLTEENGSHTVFTLSGSTWKAAPDVIASLTHDTVGTWTLRRQAQQTLTFNSSGQLTKMSDRNGYPTIYNYNSTGQLISVTAYTDLTETIGRTLQIGYNTSNQIATVTDGNVSPPRVVRYEYDPTGELTDVFDVNGGHTRYVYDNSHRMTAMFDPKCESTPGCRGVVTGYNGAGQVDSQTDQLGRPPTTFSYTGDPTSASGGTTTITDPKGNVTVDTYQYGVRISETRGAGTPQQAITFYRYDPATGQPVMIVDPNGYATSMTYDASGNMLTKTDPLSRETTWTYNKFHEPRTVTDPLGVPTTNKYDTNGNLISTSTPLVGTAEVQKTTYVYGDSAHPGDVTSMVDPDGHTWTYTYDGYGDRTSTTDPGGDKSTSTYNADGWRLAAVSPRGNAPGANPVVFTTVYTYNRFGQVLTVTDPLGHVTTNGYDADQNLTAVTDATKHTTRHTYDLANEQTAVHRPNGTTLKTTYWPDGTVKAQIDGAGNTTLYQYDPLQRVSSVTDPLTRVTSYNYDPAGNLLTTTDAKNQVTTHTYDPANQLTSISYSDGVTPSVTGITYDADGQRTAQTDGTGSWTWTWDSLHRLTAVTEGSNGNITYAYDLAGRVTKINYTPTQAVLRDYDTAGRLTKVTDWLGNTTTFVYDPDSMLTKETFPSTPAVVDNYKYNHADQLTNIADTAGTGTVFAATYSRDQDGQVASDGSAPPPLAPDYGYTTINQLCYAGTATTNACSTPANTTYSYSPADNLINNDGATQSFDAADQLCWTLAVASANACGSVPPGASTYDYDLNGNRCYALAGTTAGTCQSPPAGATIYGYDQANRLTSYTNGATTASYTYNGDGLRMTKTVSGTPSSFAWDPSGSLPLLVNEGSTGYLYGPGDLPLEQINGTTVLYYHHDQLGSTRALTDTSGTTQATFSFTPYGIPANTSGIASTPFLFAGQYKDTETGLYYLRARYYNPATGQFLTQDPAVTFTQAPYEYVGGNPENRGDSSGLDYVLCYNVDTYKGIYGLPLKVPITPNRYPLIYSCPPGTTDTYEGTITIECTDASGRSLGLTGVGGESCDTIRAPAGQQGGCSGDQCNLGQGQMTGGSNYWGGGWGCAGPFIHIAALLGGETVGAGSEVAGWCVHLAEATDVAQNAARNGLFDAIFGPCAAAS